MPTVSQADIDAIKTRIATLNAQLTKDQKDLDEQTAVFNKAMATIGNCSWHGGLFNQSWRCYGQDNQDSMYHAAELARDQSAAKMDALNKAITKAKNDLIQATADLAKAISSFALQNEAVSTANMTPRQKQDALNAQAARDLAAQRAQENAKTRSMIIMVVLSLLVLSAGIFIVKKLF